MSSATDGKHRAPHAVLDPESRRRKARKIATIVGQERPLTGLRVLDVGIGAGVIASCLAEASAPNYPRWTKWMAGARA